MSNEQEFDDLDAFFEEDEGSTDESEFDEESEDDTNEVIEDDSDDDNNEEEEEEEEVEDDNADESEEDEQEDAGGSEIDSEGEESEEDSELSDDESERESETSVYDLATSIGSDLIAKRKETDIASKENDEKRRKEAEAEYKAMFKFAPEDFQLELDAIELPDTEIEIDGQKVNFKEIEKQAPGAVALTKAIAVAVAKKLVGRSTVGIEQSLSNERFFNELSVFHPDARLLAKDDDFHAWRKTVPPEINALFESDDVLNTSLGIDIYKDHVKSQKSKATSKSKPKKSSKTVEKKKAKIEKKKKMYSSAPSKKTPKKRRSGAYQSNDDSPEALEAFWNEEEV